ncbi:30S ribosome-binding factor RbfA [Rubinisphaera margarita]|uniref:30S ribosome-binding factor RbfA n=1 Tax=Rubinisphaera margarita TaxID=2909586 RepID=UPI001EE802B9|nr:30S ribosome-binding factor RbfA [Rubinisphaera margarita]MCG6158057.1 30S ribosome-binding factor RbfA [Rubinisphaera margarita]
MSTRRTAKASRAVREVISTAILFELNDPRIKNVTVLDVDVATDMRSAKVYVSVMGDEKSQQLSLHGLNSARGFLQKLVADRIDTRYTPVLTFVLDNSVKKSIETAKILRDLAIERGEIPAEDEVATDDELSADQPDDSDSSTADDETEDDSESREDA